MLKAKGQATGKTKTKNLLTTKDTEENQKSRARSQKSKSISVVFLLWPRACGLKELQSE
jgi:hypothetical protein